MRKLMVAAFAASMLFSPALADETPKAEGTVTEAAKAEVDKDIKEAVNPDEKVDAKEVMEAAAELVGEAKVFFDKGKGEAADQTLEALKWTGIVAAVLKLLIMLLKLVIPFFKNGMVIRLACIGVGVAFGVFSYMGMGYEWYNSIIMVLSGPGAILITEVQKTVPLLRGKKE